MTSYLRFGILSSLIADVWVHQAYFYPGTTTSFDFFGLNPDFKTYGLYVKYCVEQQCDLSVFHNFRQAVTTTSTSTFKVSAASHEGSYTLSVKSGDIGFIIPHILNITAAYLCMQNPEEYLSRPLPPVYKRGRMVVVPCPVLGGPLPSVTWSKRAGGSVVDIVSDNDKYIITQLGHLFISNFSDSDVGFYSCSAKNDCGKRCFADSKCTKISAQGADYELKIQDEDEQSTDKLKYYFLNPSNVNCWIDSCFSYSRLYNNIYMYIKPNDNAHIEVFADMHSKSRYVGYKMQTQETSPRFISYSDKVCYGVLQNYTNKDVLMNTANCGAYDKFNLMSLSIAKYKLAITEPPHIELISSHTDIVEYGSNFSIEFKITKGHRDDLPTPINVLEVTCFKNSEPFLMEKGWHKQCIWNKTTNIVTLRIICATDIDTGYYQVMVKKWSGSNISVPTYVETYPHDERSIRNCFSLRHTVLSSRSVRLEWDRPNSNLTTPLIYEIVLKNLAWKEELARTHTVKLTAVVEKLHPGTPYHAHVQSKSDLVGHRIRFKTHEERPSAPPANVNCEPQEGSTWLYCIWDEIPLRQRNGDITSYRVKYRLHYEWSFSFASVGYIHIADLEPCVEYTVQVMGCTAVGCGSHEELNVKTLEDRPIYRPTLRYTISGAKNIRIGWVRPPGSFKNIFYTVNCKEQDTGTQIFSKNITDVDAVISGQSIRPLTQYIVSITPESSQGFGPTLTKEVSTLSDSFSIRSSFLLIFLSVLIVLILNDF